MDVFKNIILWFSSSKPALDLDFAELKFLDISGLTADEIEVMVKHASATAAKSSCCNRYAVVFQNASAEIHKLLHLSFMSNNIIEIGNDANLQSAIRQAKWILNDYKSDVVDNDHVFFTSDTHFNHANIIKYCNRPWNSGIGADNDLIVTDNDVDRMTEALVSNWNSVVGKDDIVWHLGDFCLGKNQTVTIPQLVSRLNGKISLVLGNHDHHDIKFYYDAGFHRVYDHPTIIKDFIILSHSPIQWVRDNPALCNLFGHVHNHALYATCTKNTYNCCVEVNKYAPISLSDIMKKLEQS